MFHPDGPTLYQLARQALSSTDHGYDQLAPMFDVTPFRTPDDLLDAVRPWLGDSGDSGDKRVGMDLCTGTGAALRVLAEVCSERVIGLDRSAGMLSVARSHALGVPVELRQQDALDLTDERVADVITCFGANGHILPPDQDRFALAIHRALRPGGRYVCLTADMPGPTQPAWWLSRGFNAVMHARNAVRSPPFIMFYLQFTTERAQVVLTRAGLNTTVHRGVLPYPYTRLHVVVAERPQDAATELRSEYAG